MTTSQTTPHSTDQTPTLPPPLLLTGIERVEVIGTPWPDVPDGWLLFNAPRPIWGSIRDGEPVGFNDRFIHGVFYTAVNPADPEAQRLIDQNRESDAWLLQVITPAAHARRLRHWVEEEYIPYVRDIFGWEIAFDDFPVESWDTQYRNDAEQRMVGLLLSSADDMPCA